MSPFFKMTVLRYRKEDNLNLILIVILFTFKYNTQRQLEFSQNYPPKINLLSFIIHNF